MQRKSTSHLHLMGCTRRIEAGETYITQTCRSCDHPYRRLKLRWVKMFTFALLIEWKNSNVLLDANPKINQVRIRVLTSTILKKWLIIVHSFHWIVNNASRISFVVSNFILFYQNEQPKQIWKKRRLWKVSGTKKQLKCNQNGDKSGLNLFVARPVEGSLTEARGQKANIHIYKEIMELCYVIDSEGEAHSEKSPQLKMIPFGQLFNVNLTRMQHFAIILSMNVKFSEIDLREDQQ